MSSYASDGEGGEEKPHTPKVVTERSALILRLISAAFLGPLALGSAYIGGPIFAALLAFILVVMCFEWARMVEGREFGRGYYFLATGGLLAMILAAAGFYGFAFMVASCAAIALRAAYGRNKSTGGWTAFGAVYLIMPCLALLWLREEVTSGRELLFLLFAIVWSSDSMAFLIGRFFGGPKLSPTLSPAKTWSGAIGGALAGGFAGLIASEMILAEGAEVFYWVVGACLGLMSIIGDLAESAFKRVFQVKDISGFIPGHGGVLDRLDGMIFACVAMTISLYAHMLWNNF